MINCEYNLQGRNAGQLLRGIMGVVVVIERHNSISGLEWSSGSVWGRLFARCGGVAMVLTARGQFLDGILVEVPCRESM